MNDILVSRAEQPCTDFATHVPFTCAGATLLFRKEINGMEKQRRCGPKLGSHRCLNRFQ